MTAREKRDNTDSRPTPEQDDRRSHRAFVARPRSDWPP
jgi:hypothetical protein